jgi:hypothetical protein
MAAALVAVFVLLPLGSCTGKSGAVSEVSAVSIEVFDRGTDGGKTDPTNNEWVKWIQEKLLKDENIDVTFVAIPRWEETVAINNLMAAGTPPDVCLTYSQELIAQYRDLGGLFDMGLYMDSPLLADLKAFLGPDPALPGRDLIRRLEDPETKAVYAVPARRDYQRDDTKRNCLRSMTAPFSQPSAAQTSYTAATLCAMPVTIQAGQNSWKKIG